MFAAMGFYPINPVSGNYMIVSPLFDSIKIQLPNHKVFQIVTHRPYPGAVYIRNVKWNEQNYDKNYLQHAIITRGGKLDIWLQKRPSSWGSQMKDQVPGLKE